MGWGAIESRLDAHFSQPKYQVLLAKLGGFELQKLRHASARIFSGTTPLSGGDAYTSEADGIPFVRSGDFWHDGNINFSEVISLKPEVHQKTMRGSRLLKGDVLFAIVGATIGKVAFYPYEREANINQAVCAVRLKSDVHPEYVAAFFQTNLGQQILDRAKRPVARANINLEEIGQMVFPRVSGAIQMQVVHLLREGYRARQNKLNHATDLLRSLDNYLFAELGITLPAEPDNTLTNRIFTAQRRELAGWRFDPLFHSFKLWHAIEGAHVATKKLGLCCHFLKSGFAAGGDMQQFDEGGVIQLRPTNINVNRELVFDRNVYLDQALLQAKPDDIVQCGEVLFNNTNSQELVGKTVYMNIEGQPFFCSNHITRISTISSELHPEYLTAILNAYQRLKVFFSLCTNWNNQSGVNVELLRHLPIPVHDINKQAAIAEHIGSIRHEAKRLRQQAEAELEAAKQKIEALLLGETP